MAVLELHRGGGSGRPPTGEEVLREALQVATDYANTQLVYLALDDPLRPEVEAFAAGGLASV